MTISRRTMSRWLLGAPLLAAAAAKTVDLFGRVSAAEEPAADQSKAEPDPTPLAKFLAKQESGLSSDEKAEVRKNVTQLEDALKTVRDFPLGNDVPPAGDFRALRTKRG
jgi:hypothetical protein